MLIGVGGDTKDKYANAAKVTIADGLALWAGESITDNTIQNYSNRVSVCKDRSRGYKYGDINIHSEHGAYTYTLGESAEQHVAHCGYCGKTEPAENHTNDGTGKCEKCGYATHVHTVKTYQATGSGTGYGEGVVTANVIPGQTVILPDIDQSSLPAYMVFEGWLQDPATALTTWEKQDGETLLEPGTTITPAANVNLYARYSYQYGTEWTWTASSTTASATLKIINLETGSVVETIAFGDERMLINAKSISATLKEPGSVQYTAQVNYTDAKGRQFNFLDDHTIECYMEVDLDENDNTTTLADKDGGTVVANLTGRTLYKNGNWNTLCLPFDVADISSSPLAGATIKEFTDVSFKDGTLTLTFADATNIKAGHAYLIKWADSGTELGPSDLVFTGVTLAKDLRDDEITVDDKGSATVTFMGTYKTLSFDADDKSILFLGAGNTLYYPKKGATIGAQRAYFKLSGITAGDLPQQARSIVLDFGDETTSISEELRVKSEKFATAIGWYTLDGFRLNGKPTTRGIYINNGKKIVIK